MEHGFPELSLRAPYRGFSTSMTANRRNHTELMRLLDALAGRLDYSPRLGDPRASRCGYYTKFEAYTGDNYQHVLRQAFDLVGVHSVFGFQRTGRAARTFTPIAYMAAAADRDEATRIHRQVWSQGVAPILLLATPQGVEIRLGLAPPPEQPVLVPWNEIGDVVLPPALNQVTRVSLAGSLVWSDFAVERRHRVDASLLSAIQTLSEGVLYRYPDFENDASLINSVIGRFLYFYILLDRRIVSADWVRGLESCPVIGDSLSDPTKDVVWPADEVWALFDAIDDAMNGSIFLISPDQRARLDVNLLHLVRRAIRNGDQIGPTSRQLTFFEVSFETLRTETISAIYELFLHLDDPAQKVDDGAFYTPPFLVDYVLDELDRIAPLAADSRVLDPAAGSGAFLVGAYRRILERSFKGPTGYRAVPEMKEILSTCIFGIEKNGQAASVARFSLYLTMLDYLDGEGIEEIHSATSPEKVFPALDHNVVNADVFDDDRRPGGPTARFTHVVGNPPWTSFGMTRSRNPGAAPALSQGRDDTLKRARDYAASLSNGDYPVSNFRLSELFVWKTHADLLEDGGVTALLVSSRSFVSRSADAFPAALLKQMQVLGVANLSHFRYRLFENARTPALALFARRGSSAPMDTTWIYSPQLSSQPIAAHGALWSIIVSPMDVAEVRVRDLQRRPEAWFQFLMLRPLDRRFAELFELWTGETGRSFGAFLGRNRLKIARGGTPGQTGIPAEYILGKTGDYRNRLGLTGLGVGRYVLPADVAAEAKGTFRDLFGGNVVLVPRSMDVIDYVRQAIAFNSSFKAVAGLPGVRVNPKGMRGLAAFLGSSLGGYLTAVYGRTWIMDRLRLETGDLLRIPFPFEDLNDPSLQALAHADDDEILASFSRALGLGPAFTDVVREYEQFRVGFEDAQMPDDALYPPGAEMVRAYEGRLIQELDRAFGSGVKFKAWADGRTVDGFRRTHVTPADRVAVHASRETSDIAFAPDGFTPGADIAVGDDGFVVSKPFVRKAWTLDQALVDANAIVALVAAS